MPRNGRKKPGANGIDRHKHMSGYNPDSMDAMAHIGFISNYLNNLPEEKKTYKTNTIIYGKTLKNIPLQSNQTLSREEIQKSKGALSKILQLWGRYGNSRWYCEETPGMYMTLTFRRKEDE